MKHVFSYDSQNRITQIVLTSLESSETDFQAIRTYQYDSKGRVAEMKQTSTYTRGVELINTYEYNEQGQLLVRRHFEAIVNCPTVELGRIEYFYGAAHAPDSSALHSIRPWHGSEMFHNLSYKSTYTNGLLARIKTYPIDPDFQFLPYEDEVRYDTRKAPFSTSPAQLAFMLNYECDEFMLNLPQLNNVTSVTKRSEDGQIHFAYDIHYTYSKEGYPLTARQKYSEGNFVEYNFEYSYTCSK